MKMLCDLSRVLIQALCFSAFMLLNATGADVTVTADVNGKGVVLGSGTYPEGSQVTLHAAPEVDWRFDHWEGAPTEMAQQNPVTIQPTANTHLTAVMAQSPGVGRYAGGPVIMWGIGEGVIRRPDLIAIDVTQGGSAGSALKPDGTVVCWGNNQSGQTNVPPGLDDVVSIDAGFFHQLAARSDGSVVGWGANNYGQVNIPFGLKDVHAVAAGGQHSVALKRNGTVVAWGRDYYGQTTPPVGLRNVIAIAAGQYFSVALKADGTAVGWGSITGGGDPVPLQMPATFTNLVAISALYNYILGLKSDGTIVQWGYVEGLPANIPPDLTNIVAISAGSDGGLAIRPDRTAIWWRKITDPTPDPRPDILIADAGSEFVTGIEGDGFGLVREFFPSVFVEEGEAILLAPNVIGGQSYQWFRNGQPIPGATLKRYSVPSVSAAEAGNYQLVVIRGAQIFTTPSTAVTVASAGYPRVLLNGGEIREEARLSEPVQVALITTLADPQIFYTLDGSTPTFSSTRYTAPFGLTQPSNVTIRALAISGDFSKEVLNDPIKVTLAPTYTVTVRATGPGRVDLTPPGGRYFQDDVVQVQAIPNAGAQFARWTDSADPSPMRNITISSNVTIEAVFELPPRYSPTIIANGGNVTLNPPDPQLTGADVTITAVPKSGWTFVNWTGDHTGTESSFIWHVAGPAQFQANFATTITTTVAGAGRIELDPNLSQYLYGSEVTVTPVPAFGNYLALWGMDAAGQPLGVFTFTVTNAPTEISGLFRPLETPAFQITNVRIETGELKFLVSGSAEKTVNIQSTSDFVAWNDEATIAVPASGSIEHTLELTSQAGRFLRLRHSP